MNNKILNLILLGVIVFLVITNLKSCQDKDYLEQKANQNELAMNDTITYYKGQYKKTAFQLTKEEAEKQDVNFKTIIKELPGKTITTVTYLTPKYEHTFDIGSQIEKINDSTYKIYFTDTNDVRSIGSETYVLFESNTIKINDTTYVEKYSLGLHPKFNGNPTKLTEKFTFGLGMATIEEKGIKKVVVTPYTLKYIDGNVVLDKKIEKELLDIPVLNSVVIDPPKKVFQNGLALHVGFGPMFGYMRSANSFGITWGPNLSFGYSIRSIKELLR
jgi:hypothetical protein